MLTSTVLSVFICKKMLTTKVFPTKLLQNYLKTTNRKSFFRKIVKDFAVLLNHFLPLKYLAK